MSRRSVRRPSLRVQSLEDRTNPSPAIRTGYVFNGPKYDDNSPATGALATPASPGIAVGKNHLVMITNNQIKWQETPNAATITPVTTDLDVFFNAGFSSVPVIWSDAQATYDPASDRFVVIAAARAKDSTECKIFIAASDDPNPNGTWIKQSIPANLGGTGGFATANYATDLGLGLDKEAIYITSSHYAFSNDGYLDARLHIITKAQLYGSVPTLRTLHDPSPNGMEAAYRYLVPAQVYGDPQTTPSGTYLVSYNGVSGGGEFAVISQVQNPLNGPTFTQTTLNMPDFDQGGALPDAPQAGDVADLDTGDRQVGNAVWRNDRLYFAATINPTAGPDAGQATAHWFNVSTSGASPTLTDHGNAGGAAGQSTFFPTVAVDLDGNLAVAYSASEDGDTVKGYYAARLATDAAGTIQPQVEINPAPTPEGSYVNLDTAGVNVWGPANSITIDPAGRGFYAYSAFATTPATSGPANNRGRWATKGVGFSFNWAPEVVPGGLSPTLNVIEDAPPAELDLDPAFYDYEDFDLTDPARVLEFDDFVSNSNPGLVTVEHVTQTGQPSRDKFRLTFTPNASGSAVLVFTAIDSGGATAPYAITVTVAPRPDAPTALPDFYTVEEDGLLTTTAVDGVLANDTDPDEGDELSAQITSPAAFGVLTFREDGTFDYRPPQDFAGTVTFKYVVKDSTTPIPLTSNEVTVTITVTAVNDPPATEPDPTTGSYQAIEDTTLNVPVGQGVLANDTDVDSPTLTAALASQASKGVVTLNSNGSFSYVPNPNAFGDDAFTYTASDGTDTSEPTLVRINISPVEDPPVASNDSYLTPEDTPLSVPAATGLLFNDREVDGQTLGNIQFTQPANGSVTVNTTTGAFTYTPDDNFFGPDTFTYSVSDSAGNVSNTATVTINVGAINDNPVAVNNTYQTPEDQTLSVPAPGVRGNDVDVDGDTLTVLQVTGPAHAAAFTLNPDGSFTYTPAPNYFGPDSFTYRLNDGTANSNVATVLINVTPVQDAPDAVDDGPIAVSGRRVTINVLGNDVDVDRDRLSVLNFTAPTQGTVTRSGTQLVYTPRPGATGSDSFTYRVSDGRGNTDTATVTLTLTDTVAPKVEAVRLFYGPNAYVDLKSIGRTVLPWENVTRVDVVFSETVDVGGGDLTLTAAGGGSVGTTFGGFDPATRTATWTFAALGTNRFALRVAGSVEDLSGNDIGSTWGRNFAVLPGDFDGNGLVNLTDAGGVKKQKGKANAFADINGDGVVNDADTARVTALQGTRL